MQPNGLEQPQLPECSSREGGAQENSLEITWNTPLVPERFGVSSQALAVLLINLGCPLQRGEKCLGTVLARSGDKCCRNCR